MNFIFLLAVWLQATPVLADGSAAAPPSTDQMPNVAETTSVTDPDSGERFTAHEFETADADSAPFNRAKAVKLGMLMLFAIFIFVMVGVSQI